MAPRQTASLATRLQRLYKVGDYFYPRISFELEVPGGLQGEAESISSLVSDVGKRPSLKEIYRIMHMKAKLIDAYQEKEGNKANTVRLFREHVASPRARPIAGFGPIEYAVASVVVILAFFFLKEFASEAGRIAAKKLIDPLVLQGASEQLRIPEEQIRILKTDAIEVFEYLRRGSYGKKDRKTHSGPAVTRCKRT